MPKPKIHFFVCINERPAGHPRGSCTAKNAMGALQAMGQKLQATQKFDTVMLSAVRSCLGPCGSGPIVVVYPDNVWYGNVTPQAAEEIFDSHVTTGKPVEKYMLKEGTF
ncbi:MAG: (2Fe-2S) ferredoxin domain-containing protein [Nitrospinae bacterium]|nr:(2Fe-2S) ferredoxin domain-containing protein [Nitrospinota bacterium]